MTKTKKIKITLWKLKYNILSYIEYYRLKHKIYRHYNTSQILRDHCVKIICMLRKASQEEAEIIADYFVDFLPVIQCSIILPLYGKTMEDEDLDELWCEIAKYLPD